MTTPEEKRSGGIRFKWLALGFGVLFVAVFGFGIFFYRKYITYERVAAYHVPAGSQAAARLDVEQVVLFAPIRKHLFPLIDQIKAAPGIKSRRARLEASSGVELSRDLRELVVACGAQLSDCVLIIGGKFPQGLPQHLAALLSEEGISVSPEPGQSYFSLNNGLIVGQATDGALIIAQSLERFQAAVPRQSNYSQVGLAAEGPGSFALTPSPQQANVFWSLLPPLFAGAAMQLSALSVRAHLALGEPTYLNAKIAAPSAGAAALASAALLPAFQFAGLTSAPFQRADVQVVGTDLDIKIPWTNAELDQLTAQFAAFISAQLAKSGV